MESTQHHGAPSITINGGNAIFGGSVTGDLLVSNESRSKPHYDRLLKSLSFPLQHARRQQISPAYSETCEWMFKREDKDGQPLPWSCFVDWLETDDTIYWIYGKPGSGKSILMKFLADHSDLENHLRVWAASQHRAQDHFSIVKASHYFWCTGTPDQNGIDGFLRTMMLQILQQQPSKVDMIETDFQFQLPWTAAKLEAIFKLLLSDVHTFYLLFVDGLDEFVGDQGTQDTLITLLQELSCQPNVKICLSSRPDLYLTDTFSGHRCLRLQDFNSRDIRKTAEGRLSSIPRIQQYQATDGIRARSLIDALCSRSDGVFLWLYLALEDLVRGLKQRDSLSQLLARLDFLGNSLTTLFRGLWSQIEPVYRSRAVQLLRLQMLSTQFNALLSTLQLYAGVGSLENALTGHLQHGLDLFLSQIQLGHATAAHDLFDELQALRESVNAKTAGLLEVRDDKYKTCRARRGSECTCMDDVDCSHIQSLLLPKIVQHFSRETVEYVHRSAHEFLATNATVLAVTNESTVDDVSSTALWISMEQRHLDLLTCTLATFLDHHQKAMVLVEKNSSQAWLGCETFQGSMTLLSCQYALTCSASLSFTSIYKFREAADTTRAQSLEKFLEDMQQAMLSNRNSCHMLKNALVNYQSTCRRALSNSEVMRYFSRRRQLGLLWIIVEEHIVWLGHVMAKSALAKSHSPDDSEEGLSLSDFRLADSPLQRDCVLELLKSGWSYNDCLSPAFESLPQTGLLRKEMSGILISLTSDLTESIIRNKDDAIDIEPVERFFLERLEPDIFSTCVEDQVDADDDYFFYVKVVRSVFDGYWILPGENDIISVFHKWHTARFAPQFYRSTLIRVPANRETYPSYDLETLLYCYATEVRLSPRMAHTLVHQGFHGRLDHKIHSRQAFSGCPNDGNICHVTVRVEGEEDVKALHMPLEECSICSEGLSQATSPLDSCASS